MILIAFTAFGTTKPSRRTLPKAVQPRLHSRNVLHDRVAASNRDLNVFGRTLQHPAPRLLERISKRRGQLKPKAKDDESRFRPYCNSSSGEPSIGVRFVAGRHAWTVVLGEDLADQFSAAPHADLVEDRLEVITHGVRRDVQLLGDLGR